MTTQVCSITLAAGAGSRMPDGVPPKPCCRIGPVSVLESALEGYEQAGIRQHVVVVGSRAEEVMGEASRCGREVLFAYQKEQRGTGDAVRCALELLETTLQPKHVLICSGDKVVAPYLVRGLVDSYGASENDLRLLAAPATENPTSGRIIRRDGKPQAIVEVPDIRAHQLAARLRALGEEQRPASIAELAGLGLRAGRQDGRLLPRSERPARWHRRRPGRLGDRAGQRRGNT